MTETSTHAIILRRPSISRRHRRRFRRRHGRLPFLSTSPAPVSRREERGRRHPPPPSSPCLSSAAVARRGLGDGPRCRSRGLSWSKGGGIKDNDGSHRRQPLSPITVAVVAVVAAAANAASTTPSPLPPPSLSLQPLPTSLHLQRSCRWLVVVSSVALCLLRCPPSEFISPRHHAIVDAFSAGPPSPFAYHRQPLSCRSFTEHQSLLPLLLMVGCCILRPPSSIPTTSPSQNVSSFHPLGLILTYLE